MKVISKEEMVNTIGTQLEPSELVVLDQGSDGFSAQGELGGTHGLCQASHCR